MENKILIITVEKIDGFPEGRRQYGRAVIYNGFANAKLQIIDHSFGEIFVLVDDYDQCQVILEQINKIFFKKIYIMTSLSDLSQKQTLSNDRVFLFRRINRPDIICCQLIAEANE